MHLARLSMVSILAVTSVAGCGTAPGAYPPGTSLLAKAGKFTVVDPVQCRPSHYNKVYNGLPPTTPEDGDLFLI